MCFAYELGPQDCRILLTKRYLTEQFHIFNANQIHYLNLIINTK